MPASERALGLKREIGDFRFDADTTNGW